jgi:hypothetical protein
MDCHKENAASVPLLPTIIFTALQASPPNQNFCRMVTQTFGVISLVPINAYERK